MAEFILKDWYGKNCTFGDDKIFVQDANGELVEFTQGKGESVLEPLEVTENGTYTPSEGVDGFSSVLVDVLAKAETTLKFKKVFFTSSGSWGQRVNTNHGFKPDLIIVHPSNDVTVSDKNCIFMGSSENFKNLMGASVSNTNMYFSSNKFYTTSVSTYIEKNNDALPIYNADETGFNIGKSVFSGSAYALIFGF